MPRRIAAIGAAGLLTAAAVAVITSTASGPLTPVGAVQGAAATMPRTPTMQPESPAPTVRPTASPAPTATPLPTPLPVALLEGYRRPLANGRLTLPFGPSPWGSRIVDGEPFHDGVDFATFCGDRIVAAHAGTVLAAGRKFDAHMGWVGDLQPYLDRLERKHLWSTLPIAVVIDDGNGYRSIYAHFSKTVVKTGQTVKAGQLLGYEGRTGRASGCHLHYGLFSPLETATFGIDPDVVKRMRLPDRQLARVDPLLVLPEKASPAPKATPRSSGAPGRSPGSP